MTPRETLIAYLLMKVEQEDWHAVCDAGMDLRELDAEARGSAKLETRPILAVAVNRQCPMCAGCLTYEAATDTLRCGCGFWKAA